MRSVNPDRYRLASLLVVLAHIGFLSRPARANGLEIPENGTELMGRAGAWTARADNPLAAAYNPAGLAGQPLALLANTNLTWQSMCFQRAGNYGNNTNDLGTVFQGQSYSGQPYPEVCKENGLKNVNAVPQLAIVYPVTPKLGVSFAFVTPSAAGKAEWPEQVTTGNGARAPAPQRYLLLSQNGIVISPTLAAGYEVTPGLRFGIALQAVMSFLTFSSATHALNTQPYDADEASADDLKGELKLTKWFTPAIVLGAMVNPTTDLDIGAMFRYGADIDIKGGDLTVHGPMYGNASSAKNTPAETKASVERFALPQPLELRLGIRFHPLRKDVAPKAPGYRDFLANDVFDIELDSTYSRNAVFQDLVVSFPPNQYVTLGTTQRAGVVPTVASIPHHWKDTFGLRLGGEYVVLPDRLGLRAGGFFQTSGQDPQYLSIDFLPSQMFGLYLGGTFRVSTSLDVSLGYGHIFLSGLDNKGDGKVFGLMAQEKWNPGVCDQNPPPPDFHTCHPVNSGKVSGGYNMFSLGATLRL